MIPYLGDFKEGETVYVMFNTFTSDDPSASCTITNFTNTDVHIYKNDDLTQRNNAAGITVSIDFDGITGSHLIKIDTSDDTVSGFWVPGKDYFVRIEGTTVDGATINAVVGHFSIENRFNEVDLTRILGTALTESASGYLAAAFKKLFDVETPMLVASDAMRGTDNAALASGVNMTQISGDSDAADNLKAMFNGTGLIGDNYPANQKQVGLISSGAAAIATTAESATITTGTETGTYANTTESDETFHIVEPDGGITDFYYQFDIGSNTLPVGIDWEGYANGQGDEYESYAYNWNSSSWEQLGTCEGINGVSLRTMTKVLTTAHVGTSGGDVGKVRFRIYSTTGSKIATDRLLCTYSIVAPTATEIRTEMEDTGTKLSLALEDTDELQTNQGNWVTATTVALNAQGKADVNAEVDAALADYDPPTKAELDAAESNIRGSDSDTLKTISDQVDGLNDPSASAIADAVWDEAIADHTTSTTFGGKNQKVVPSETLADYKADVSSLAVEANIETHVTNSLNSYDPPTRAELTSDKDEIITEVNANETKIDALNDLSAAEVNAEVCDVLKTDTSGEPAQGAPAETASIEAKVAWLYKLARNKITNDGTDIKVYNDAGTVVDHKASVSESGGTVTRAKFGTGA